MSMTRREWLTRVIGGAAAVAIAPLIDMTDMTPAFWNQEPLQKLMPWRISFASGDVFSFDAAVLAERLLDDGSIEFDVQPKGPVTVTSEPKRLRSRSASPSTLHREDGTIFELQEIAIPELTRANEELDDILIPGLRRTSSRRDHSSKSPTADTFGERQFYTCSLCNANQTILRTV
jgi:hypothetical protein